MRVYVIKTESKEVIEEHQNVISYNSNSVCLPAGKGQTTQFVEEGYEIVNADEWDVKKD